jgi:hypothetical protein
MSSMYVMNFSLSISNLDSLMEIGKYQPPEVALMSHLSCYLNGLHIEPIVNTIYDILNFSLLELRGTRETMQLTDAEVNDILHYHKDRLKFMKDVLSNVNSMALLQKKWML